MTLRPVPARGRGSSSAPDSQAPVGHARQSGGEYTSHLRRTRREVGCGDRRAGTAGGAFVCAATTAPDRPSVRRWTAVLDGCGGLGGRVWRLPEDPAPIGRILGHGGGPDGPTHPFDLP